MENGFRQSKQTFVEEEEDVVVGDVVDVGDHLEFDVIQLGHVDGPRTASTATHRHGALLVCLTDHRVRSTVGRKLHATRWTGYSVASLGGVTPEGKKFVGKFTKNSGETRSGR